MATSWLPADLCAALAWQHLLPLFCQRDCNLHVHVCRHIVGLIGLGALDDSTDEALRDTFYLVRELFNSCTRVQYQFRRECPWGGSKSAC
jgi:hypothetical protein